MSLKQAKQSAAPRFGRLDADLADVESAVVRSRDFLFSQQHPDGYWCGELEADSMLEADYIYLHTQLESGAAQKARPVGANATPVTRTSGRRFRVDGSPPRVEPGS